MLTAEQLEAAARGDLAVLIDLDRRGLLVGAEETPQAYADRLRRLCENTARMEQELAANSRYEVEGVTVLEQDRIPTDLFGPARQDTEALYGVSPDWVPGFFANPSQGWLFGGCAFYFYPDFFALFIVRKAFATRSKWLIYDRTELLAHELCHVARVGLHSQAYEELVAYRTATTGFRRALGSVFRSPTDSLLLLGSTMVLLLAQVLQSTVLPAMPMVWFWLGVTGLFAFLGLRHAYGLRTFARALANLAPVAGDRGGCVLFRCTDEEITRLAELDDPAELGPWLEFRYRNSTRWQVTRARFLTPPGADASSAPAAPAADPASPAHEGPKP